MDKVKTSLYPLDTNSMVETKNRGCPRFKEIFGL